MSYESKAQHQPALYELAEDLHDMPDGFAAYDYAKCVWLGAPDPEVRRSGDHPWPTRDIDGQHYVYATPTFAGVNPELATVLYVGRDNWRPIEDPHSWMVAEANLQSGREITHRVLSASVDAGRQLWLQLAPSYYGNQPPLTQQAIRRQPRHTQIALAGQLSESFYMERAVFREGMQVARDYEDYVALESMIRMVAEVREAHEAVERETLHRQAVAFALGHRGAAFSAAVAA